MFKKTLMVAGIGLAISTAAQADYRWQAEAGYATGNIEQGSEIDTDQDIGTLAGTFYLDSVDTSKGPLGEAAFIDRASNVGLTASYGELDGDGFDSDVYSYGVNGRYIFGDGGWIVDGSFQRDETDNVKINGVDFNNDLEVDTYSVGFGKYIFENTTLVATYASADVDNGGDTDGGYLDIEHLCLLDNGGALKVGAGFGMINVDDGDDIDRYSLAAAYYINKNASFGVNYANSDSDDVDRDAWSAYFEMFFTENIAVNVAIGEIEGNNIDSETDALTVGVVGRF